MDEHKVELLPALGYNILEVTERNVDSNGHSHWLLFNTRTNTVTHAQVSVKDIRARIENGECCGVLLLVRADRTYRITSKDPKFISIPTSKAMGIKITATTNDSTLSKALELYVKGNPTATLEYLE